jgi:hypothetical protein
MIVLENKHILADEGQLVALVLGVFTVNETAQSL